MNHNKPERGQALVLIVFAIVALVGLTGLAIDGGNAYSDRRNAQNAADTAALAAALSKVQGADQTTWATVGEQRAASNGYTDSSNGATVKVYECDQSNGTDQPSCNLPATEDASQYVGVVITSNIRTYFAPVLGIRQMTNTVQAVAKAQPQTVTPYDEGHTLVSTMPGCKNDQNQTPFTIGGSANVNITGSGVKVNSSCDPAFTENGGPSMTSPGICVVGGVPNTSGITPPPQGGCGTQTDYSQYITQEPSCTQAGQINKVNGNWVASPGNYNSTFPNVSPAGTLILQKGIYCLNNGISLQSNWNITTDVNGNGTYDGATEGVLLYVPNGSVTFNGGSTIYLHAITTGTDNFPPELMGYLIYLPPTNTSPVKITGGSGSQFIGTIFAPASQVTLEGSGGILSLDCQIIGNSINIAGSGSLNINYNADVNAKAYTKPQLQLTK